ncbi:unnamed protein product, partial [Prorocentrum cordatum]
AGGAAGDTAPAAAGAPELDLKLGDRVEVRDRTSQEWKLGVVMSVDPLKVKPSGWKVAVTWKFVRRRTADATRRAADAARSADGASLNRGTTVDSLRSTSASSGAGAGRAQGDGAQLYRASTLGSVQSAVSTATGSNESGPEQPQRQRGLRTLLKRIAGARDLDPFSPSNAVIIFDWDDTLFPTWFLGRGSQDPLLSTSANREAFLRHGETVLAALRGAREVARVAIVTLASKEWVHSKCELILPGGGFPRELRSLGIHIYYAEQQNEDDSRVLSKKHAMAKCLGRMYSGLRSIRWNVLSIGDSTVEQRALKELLGEHSRGALCKTVKFPSEPTLEQLTGALGSVLPQLKNMVQHTRDFDRTSSDMWLRRESR